MYLHKDMENHLRTKTIHALKHREAQASGKMAEAHIIARRGAVAGCCFHVVHGAKRLMPLAAKAIIELDQQGKDLDSGSVWWASSLGAPRGRMERQWWAPEGGIYFCIALYPELEQRLWPLYSIAMGVAIADVMRGLGVQAKIMWINDILLNGRKISGTIAETVHAPDSGQTYLLIGTGINVNIASFPPDLHQASSLFIETGRRWSETELGTEVIAAFGWYLGVLHQWEAQNLGKTRDEQCENPVISTWRQLTDCLGRAVIFGRDLEREQGEHGMSVDIAPDGRLIIRNSDKEIIRLDSGEIRYA